MTSILAFFLAAGATWLAPLAALQSPTPGDNPITVYVEPSTDAAVVTRLAHADCGLVDTSLPGEVVEEGRWFFNLIAGGWVLNDGWCI